MTELQEPLLACKQLDGITVWTDDVLFGACGVRVAFTGRAGGSSEPPFDALNLGNHVGDDLRVVAENRERALAALGGAGLPCIVPKQVHGTRVVAVADPADVGRVQADAEQGADAVLIGTAGVAAQLSFADCLPLVVVSPTGRFAVVHAGWRGALAGIAGRAVQALAQADEQAGGGNRAASCNAYIGPYIQEECFETGDEVVDSFVEAYGAGSLAPSGRVSLSRAVAIDMQRAGLDVRRIADVNICTVCNAHDYYSFRATDGRCGRHGAIAFRL